MPTVEVCGLRQKAVLWPNAGYDRNGDPTFGTAVEIDVRWEEGLVESVSPEGSPRGITDSVFVGQDITIGSKMWQGALADLPSPIPDGEDKIVVDFIKTPDIKGKKFTRTVSLMRI